MPSNDGTRNLSGLLKIAGLQTVGDFMHAWNADINANPAVRRNAFNRINAFGIDVKQPASRLPYILGGGVVGRAAASYFGAGSFGRNLATVGGALYGNHLYNNKHPDKWTQKIGGGLVYRGF